MKTFEQRLTRLLCSSFGTTLLAVCGLLAMWLTMALNPSAAPNAHECGIVATAPALPIATESTRAIASLAIIVAAILVILLINKWFNPLHSSTTIHIGLAAAMMGAVPALIIGPLSGATLAFVAMFALLTFYTAYANPRQTRRLFLIFFLIACGSCAQFAFAPFALILLLGFGQMRCFSLRTLLAALVGLFTPYWILCGSGLVSIHSLQLPSFAPISPATIAMHSLPVNVFTGFIIALTMFITLANLIKVYGFNAKTRAINGLLSSLSIFTMIMCLLDWGNLAVYHPLLFLLTALQTTLFLNIRRQSRGYIAVLLIIAACLSTFIWSLCDLA